jgi:hypothetical protein
VICLNSGSYGNVSLMSKTYSSSVTVRPVASAAVTIGRVDLTSVSNLHFTGNGGGSATMRMAGGDPMSGALVNITFDYLTVTGCTILNLNNSFSNVLYDHDRFDNIGPCTYEGRMQIFGGASSIKVTISNSHFAGAGPGGQCTDGMQIDTAGGGGVRVGPGNEFTNIQQGVCTNGAHADPIQFYHGVGPTTITGNYFHDNGDGSGGIGSFDGADGVTVSNNVFVCTCAYPYSVAGWGGDNWTVTHNTFAGGGELSFRNANSGETPSGDIVRDNAWINGGSVGGSGFTASYNLNCSCSGANNVTGTAVLVSSPSSGYYHYQLASSSPGYHAASDGKSMGVAP